MLAGSPKTPAKNRWRSSCARIEAGIPLRGLPAFCFMRTGELISVREYLTTSHDPDCDYVDGVVEERNGGKIELRTEDPETVVPVEVLFE